MTDVETQARALARAALDKKGENLRILDLRGLANFTDFFVIVTGTNPRQNSAIAEAVRMAGKGMGLVRLGLEGSDDQSWILLDFGGIIVHVFLAETREFYALEFLWGDAREVKAPKPGPPSQTGNPQEEAV